MMEKWYKVSESELRELIHDSMIFCALQDCGVNNWIGYDASVHEFLVNNAMNKEEDIYDVANRELENYEEVRD